MVDTVQSRCDKNAHQYSLERKRQIHVRMVEQDAQQQEDLPNCYGHGRGADRGNLRRSEGNRDCDFAEVEAESRSRIHLLIQMVYLMKPPKCRNAVRHVMPPVKGVVEQQNTQGRSDYPGQM